jgi:hypothetical protein
VLFSDLYENHIVMSFLHNIQDQKSNNIQILISSRLLFSILKNISDEKIKQFHQNNQICFEQFQPYYLN